MLHKDTKTTAYLTGGNSIAALPFIIQQLQGRTLYFISVKISGEDFKKMQ
jgi:hypothetical protein